jgi:kynurenine formamidase
MDSAKLPSYDELPRIDELDAACSWGVFGEDDQVGTVNLLTPDVIACASSEIVRGSVFNLSLPLNLPDPAPPGRSVYRHAIFSPERNINDDVLDNLYLQSSSQWDGLRHIRAREFGFYNGAFADEAKPSGDKLGIQHWADHGIAGRGVLLDVASFLADQGSPLDAREEYSIRPDLLQQVATAEQVTFRMGDILLVRTGYIAAYLAADPSERRDYQIHGACPGLAADESTARFLWDEHFAAVAVDNHSFENYPGSRKVGFLHRRLIPMLGLALGEWINLEDLAADCRADGKYTCFFVSVPLNLPGGVGSPINAIALK